MLPNNPIITTTRYVILDSTQDMSSNHSANEASLLCCRACLSSDGRVLFDMADNDLINVFSRVVGIPIMDDLLPRYLCVYCRSLLLRCASFKDKCVQIHNRLLHELCNGTLNTEAIRRINHTSNRFLNLSITGVEILDCVPSEDINDMKIPNYDLFTPEINMDTVEYSGNVDVLLVEDIKNIETVKIEYAIDEPNIDAIDINSFLKRNDDSKDFGNKIEEILTSDENTLNKVVKNKRKVQTNIKKKSEKVKANKNEEIIASDEKSSIKAVKNRRKVLNNIKKKTERVKPKLKIEKCDKDDSVHVSNSQTESRMATDIEDDKKNLLYDLSSLIKKNEENLATENTSGGKCNDSLDKKRRRDLKKGIKKEMREMARNKTFESDYSVRVVVLSKEEQLAEVLARQESRNYQESEYRCEQCFKGFCLEATYENHMLTHSLSLGAFSCEICHKRFAMKRRWLKHLVIHRFKIFCKKCGFMSRTRGKAKQHHAMHAGKTFECPHCGKSFLKMSSFLGHVRLAHSAHGVACDVCGEVFVGLRGLGLHKARVHTEKIKCTVCSAKFANLAALNRHMDAAGEHTDLPCEQCGENCASEEALQEHVREKHPTESHRCEECDMSFPCALALETHVLRKHRQRGYTKAASLPTSRRRPYRPGRGEHMCDQCGKILPSAANLQFHQRIHKGVKPFVCDLCQKAFILKQALIWHMRTHTGEKPYKCPECPRAFSSKYNFNRHHKTVHLGVRGCFPCPICGSASTTRSSLRVHIDAKHGGKGWPRKRKQNKNALTQPENK